MEARSTRKRRSTAKKKNTRRVVITTLVIEVPNDQYIVSITERFQRNNVNHPLLRHADPVAQAGTTPWMMTFSSNQRSVIVVGVNPVGSLVPVKSATRVSDPAAINVP